MTKGKKIISAFLSVCIVAVPVATGIISANAESVESLQQRIEELDNKNKEYQQILDSAQDDIAEKEEYNDALVSKIENLDEKISVTRQSIETYNARITESQGKIDQGNAAIEDQVDALCERLRSIYMAGSASDLEIILGAKDFSDLIDKMTLVKNLSKYDQDLIEDINGQLDVINTEKEQLVSDKAELEKSETSLQADLDELNTLLEENKETLKDLYTKSDEAQNFLANSGDEKAQLESEIAKYFAEQAAAQAAAQQQQQSGDSTQSGSTTSQSSDTQSSQSSGSTETSDTSDSSSSGGSSSGGSSDYSGGGSVTPASSGYTWPTPGFYYLSSEWNEDRTTYNHGAIDIAGGGIMGATVVAAASGTVAYTNTYCPHNWGKSGSCGCGGGYGKYVWIDHGNGKETIYAHLSSVSVSPGQYVSAGQVVGYVGSTGYSTGPHLHFECRYNGVKYNPMTEF